MYIFQYFEKLNNDQKNVQRNGCGEHSSIIRIH